MEEVCQDIQEQIPELITGALPPERSAELRQHIDQCPSCSEYLQALQADDKLLRDFAEGMQPAVGRLEDKVIEALSSEPSKQPVRFALMWRTISKSAITKFAAAAVIIIVVLIGVKIFTGRVEQERLEIVSSQNASHRRDEDIPSSVFVEHEKPEVAAPAKVAVGTRKRTKPTSDAELEAELAMVRKMIAAGDIDGLARILERGRVESRLKAADYLARIGEPRGIAVLKELLTLYVSGEPNSALAISSVAGRVADEIRSPDIFEVRKGKKAQRLDGKDVVVRLYKDWRVEPAKFETVSVRVAGRSVNFDSIKFDSNDIGDSAVVAVFGEDQSDVNVAEAMGDCIYVELYKKGLRFSLPFGRFDSEEGLVVVFHDAFDANAAAKITDWDFSRGKPTIGKPIPEAEVEIFLRAYKGPRIQVGRYMLDERGSLPMPRTRGSLNWFDFVVLHPEYGTARVSKALYEEPMTVISLPLVRRDSVAAERAIWGTIRDPQGNPVAGATIECGSVRTLGEGLINSADETCKVVSDANGFFTFYMPNRKRRDERGLLLPPKSRYQVKIEAPKELELVSYVGGIMNGQETLITMERAGYFHTFVFEGGTGQIIDLGQLKIINLVIDEEGGSRLNFGYDDWKNGGMFPLGTYQAAMDYGRGAEFEPLEVNEDSPEELIFKLQESIIYHGRVVEALTGEPMQGAFVIGMWGTKEGNLSHITSEQWEVLHELANDPCLGDEALEPINRVYGFNKVVRTDEDGRFEMSFRPGGRLYGFVAFEENYLGVMHRKHALKPDENRRAEIPVIKLYPAAKVTIEPRVEGKRISIWPRWVIDKEDNPAWVKEFLATDDRRERLFTYDKWLKQNEVQTFYVPAGLDLRIKLDTPYDRQWCPIDIDETINLQQGETYDLGRHTFQSALKVSVRVVDFTTEPVEGVPVSNKSGDRYGGVAHNTDENGMVRFNVCSYSSGEFGVSYDDDELHLRETIPYEIAGPNDANSVYTLQISDEMVEQLFK